MEGIEIREPRADEWKELSELRIESVGNEPTAFARTPEEERALTEETWLKRIGRHQYLVAISEGKMVGMVGIVRQDGPKNEHIAKIVSMYVATDYRHKGIGKALMHAVIALGRTMGLRKLRISAAATQTVAQRLYESLGFEKNAEYKAELKVGDEYIDEIGYEMMLS